MKNSQYAIEQQVLATAWKARTATLAEDARAASPWINQEGRPVGAYGYCLPEEFAEFNLLPDVRMGAIQLFDELGIPWHSGVAGGPGNHLLSSQVQCVNALFPMVADADRIVQAFGHLVDIAEVLEIEPGRFLTFEFIGPDDYFGEGRGKERVRGSMCTSVDAAFLYRTTVGKIELALVEWKYTESYTEIRKPNASYDKTRANRYLDSLMDADSPLRSDVLDFEWLLDEPFYQLMRQQLLARRLEKCHVGGADIVRVLHVLPPDNAGYQESLVRPAHRHVASTVDQVWERLLKAPDRFLHVDPDVFLDRNVTSTDYVDRYAPTPQP